MGVSMGVGVPCVFGCWEEVAVPVEVEGGRESRDWVVRLTQKIEVRCRDWDWDGCEIDI